MLPKKFPVKPKALHFSSEDSQDTDPSMNSSMDIAESMELNNAANKFNQLRETMNKYFQVNPELAAAIRFEQFEAPEEEHVMKIPKDYTPDISVSPTNKRSQSKKTTRLLEGKPVSSALRVQAPEETQISKESTKLWTSIGREMGRTLKGTSVPTVGQINHALNLYKRDFEKPGVLEHTMASPKALASPKRFNFDNTRPDFRIQSAKVASSTRNKSGKDGKGKNDQSQEEEGEDGVSYFSFRKRMHVQTKLKRRQEAEQSRLLQLKEEEDKEKRSKDKDAKIINTLADLDEEMNLNRRVGKENTEKSNMGLRNYSSNPVRANRRTSTKVSSTIFDRLAQRENTLRGTETNDSPTKRDQFAKTFTSQFAETLYNDMKSMGYSDGFRKTAKVKIETFKKDFKERVTKQKQGTSEGLKFTKEGSKHFNLYLPDFERTAHVSNKDAVFIINEPPKHSEEWREHKENEILEKFQKIATGNLMNLWRDAKDLNQ